MSNRFSCVPFSYTSIDDLQRGLLTQMRRFNGACAEIAASNTTVVSLGPASKKDQPKPVAFSDKMDNDLGQLELMRAQVVLLKSMIGQLKTKFVGNPRAAIIQKSVDGLVDDIEHKAESFRKALGADAKEKMDPSVERINRSLMNDLDADLTVEHVRGFYLLGGICEPGSTTPTLNAEVAYIRLENLTDSEGYKNPHYFIMLGFPRGVKVGGKDKQKYAANEEREKQDIFVAVSHEFKVPAKIRWESTVQSTGDLKKVARNMLIRDGLISQGTKRSIPIPGEKVTFNHANIKKTTVLNDGSVIQVSLKDTKNMEQDATELFAQLKALVSADNPRNKDVLRYKIDRSAGNIKFIFSLPGRLKGRMLPATQEKLIRLKNELNLTDKEVTLIRTAIEDHEE